MTETVLWVPSAVAIRVSVSLLPDPALIAAVDDAWTTLDVLIDSPAGRRHHPWGQNLGALTVYGLWAALELRERQLTSPESRREQVRRIAARQYDFRHLASDSIQLHPAAGPDRILWSAWRSTQWLKPSWWGSKIHQQHRRELEQTYPCHLTSR
ncbi:hypothetical protein ACFV9C_42210 [Kribbella sp. NPDC059898]|uniref:hypothetical protein n=1 Tax=Kribbella sp. NPDC059898 TaxID=3346995 RepID=UPI00366675F1